MTHENAPFSDRSDTEMFLNDHAGTLDIHRYINGVPATKEQLAEKHMISDARAMAAIASAMARAAGSRYSM